MMKTVTGAIASIGLLAAAIASATTYYVDAENGNDQASGTHPEQAWKSIAMVNLQSLQPGDRVQFHRGQIFRGGTLRLHSGEPGRPVTYSSYGTGHKPAIQPSMDYNDSAKWEEAGEDLWRTKTSMAYTVKTDGINQDLRNSNWHVYVEEPAVVRDECVDRDDGKVYTFHCQRQGDRETNVQLLGPLVENGNVHMLFTYRIRSDKPFSMSRFRIMQTSSPWVSFALEMGGTAQVTTEWQEMACFLYHDGICPDGTTIRINNFFGKTFPEGAVVEFQPISLKEVEFNGIAPLLSDVGNVIFDHGKACGWKRWSVEELKEELDYFHDTQHGILFMHHKGNPGGGAWSSLELAPKANCVNHSGAHDVVVDGLWCRYSGAHGFGGGNAQRVTIRNCDICYIGGSVLWTHNNTRYGNGVEFWCGSQDCLVENNHIWQVYDVAITNQGNTPHSPQRNLIYRNNFLHNCEQHYEYWRSPESAVTENVQFIGNTCVNAGQSWAHWQRPDKHSCHLLAYQVVAPTRNLVIRDNVFFNAREALILHHSDLRSVMDCDYNLWFQEQPDGMLIRLYPVQMALKFSEFATWQTENGKDLHSIAARPVFVRPDFEHPENGDFHLAPDSPGAHGASDGGPIGIRN